jgi:transposase
VICQSNQKELIKLANTAQAIDRYLKSLSGPLCLAVEATNTFHLALIERAHALGHTVYLIDGYRLNRYREGVGGRAKTDDTDARLLLRYLEREAKDLRPWTPPPKGYRLIQRLLRRRARLVQARVALAQSLKGLPELKASARAILRQFDRIEAVMGKRLAQALIEHGWQSDARRCQGIEGIGPISSAALVMAFNRGEFKSADAFIAFIGLDVRVRDSGASRGRRKLTKQGDPELRRLLYLAAMQACRREAWQGFYQRHLARGQSKIQALVALARKLARVAFALLKNKTDYQPKIPINTGLQT